MNEIIVASLSFLGMCIGSITGILTANRLTIYRISLLEKKVERHNSVIERTFILEEKMKVANHRLEDLEKM